jgi:hypothetical protein
MLMGLNHHGSQLAALYLLWSDFIKAPEFPASRLQRVQRSAPARSLDRQMPGASSRALPGATIGDEQDELFSGMLDAVACFEASTFDSLHGYYRSAFSNLRSALELVAIGSLTPVGTNMSKRSISILR